MPTTLRSDELVINAPGPATTSPVVLAGLPARTVSVPFLTLDANGDVRQGALGATAETIASPWTFTGTPPLTLSPATFAPPEATTTGGPGTKVLLYPGSAGLVPFALGLESGHPWLSSQYGFKFYTGTICRLRLDSAGTLHIENGTAELRLAGTSGGDGYVTSQQNLWLQSTAANIMFRADQSPYLLPHPGYRLNLGAPWQKWLTFHGAELWVETLVAQEKIATIGGRVVIGPTTTLVKDLAAVTGLDDLFYVKHNQMQPGDRAFLEAVGKFEMIYIGNGPYEIAPTADVPFTHWRYQVRRDDDGSGATAWNAGDAVVNTGYIGDGFIDLYSVNGVHSGTAFGPTIVGNVRTGEGATQWAPRWALGHLEGVYGNATGIYGACFGPPDGAHLQIDQTNISFRDPANAMMSQWRNDGTFILGYYPSYPHVYISTTGISLKAGGVDRIHLAQNGIGYFWTGVVIGDSQKDDVFLKSWNTSAWNSGTGFYFMAGTAGVGRALIGNAGGERLQWDGSNLYLYGRNVTIEPTRGISVLSTPGTTWQPGYGVNVTSAAYGGYAALWGYEQFLNGYNTRGLVLDNTMTGATYSFAKTVIQGQGTDGAAAPAQAYAVTMESAGSGLSNVQVSAGALLITANTLIGTNTRYAVGQLELTANSAYKPVSGSWTVPADLRAKRDVESVDGTEALDLVRRARIVRYAYTGALNTPADARGIGVVADEMAAVLPHSITTAGPDQIQGWNPHELLMLTVCAVQELARRLDRGRRHGHMDDSDHDG